MTVYVLTGTWCTTDAGDSFVEVYDSYEKAIEHFNMCVADELNSYWFSTLYSPDITECPGHWEVYQDDCNYARYEIIEREVQ